MKLVTFTMGCIALFIGVLDIVAFAIEPNEGVTGIAGVVCLLAALVAFRIGEKL